MTATMTRVPRRYCLWLVAPTTAALSYTILRAMLGRATLQADTVAYLCAKGPAAFGDQNGYTHSFQAVCGGGGGSGSAASWVGAVLATVPAVQLFTPLLAAVLLMLLVTDVHSRQVRLPTGRVLQRGATSPAAADRSSEAQWIQPLPPAGRT